MKKFLTITSIVLLLISFSSPVFAVTVNGVGKLTLSPQSATVGVGGQTSIDVQLNTANTAISSVAMRATIPVSNGDIQVVSITPNAALLSDGWSFPVKSANTANGVITIDIAGLNIGTDGYQNAANTTMVTIQLKANVAFNAKTIAFDATQTKMLKKSDSQDILSQPVNGTISATSTGTGGTTNTPTATVTTGVAATATKTPTATQPPVGGSDIQNTAPTCSGLTSNIVSATGTPVTVTFTCMGTDTEGSVASAEFSFGDGKTQVVNQKTASGGFLTTHTYTTVGTFAITCKVKDNAGSVSTIPTACTKTLAVKPAPTNQKTVTVITTAPTETITAAPTETLQSPPEEDPLYTADATTPPPVMPTESPVKNPLIAALGSENRTWIILGGACVLFVGLGLFLVRRRPPMPPTPPPQTPQPPTQVQAQPEQAQYPPSSAPPVPPGN